MTTFPGSPKLQRGSIVTIDLIKKARKSIPFQYNPDTLTRRLTAQTTSGNYDRSEAFRLKGPPEETISLEIEIDATDELEEAENTKVTTGVYPKLAALELLLYPGSDHVMENDRLAHNGAIEVVPPQAPLTLLVWNQRRALPVRLNSFSITEEAFDPNLNPIRAKVGLELTVLTYMDLGLPSTGGQAFITYQQRKEEAAGQNTPRQATIEKQRTR